MPGLSTSSIPASVRAERATSSARERSSRPPARESPCEKISNPVESTSARRTNATTTSISVNPADLALFNRHPSGEPVDVDEVLALARRHRDPPAGGAAVRIEADAAAMLARDLAFRGIELELDAVGELARALVA